MRCALLEPESPFQDVPQMNGSSSAGAAAWAVGGASASAIAATATPMTALPILEDITESISLAVEVVRP
ncbi:hypothetical protein GCM10022267_11100 [Lentzea roselyniae]|uniref:Uncharacterized protein n=1 Tax=Lentzea roselyniae TaxID=531940 RepID=A0ABP7A7P2_9PSEU